MGRTEEEGFSLARELQVWMIRGKKRQFPTLVDANVLKRTNFKFPGLKEISFFALFFWVLRWRVVAQ